MAKKKNPAAVALGRKGGKKGGKARMADPVKRAKHIALMNAARLAKRRLKPRSP